MRLTGGDEGRQRLVSPRGQDIRPTSDRVREALFSILASRGLEFAGLRVLDLFAGAGTLGLEALSRGAASACFVDINSRALQALEANLERLGYRERAEVVRRGAPQVVEWLAARPARFDLIFADPPYGLPALRPTLEALEARQVLSPDGLLVVEHDRDAVLPEVLGGLSAQDVRRYGRTLLTFYSSNTQTSLHPEEIRSP